MCRNYIIMKIATVFFPPVKEDDKKDGYVSYVKQRNQWHRELEAKWKGFTIKNSACTDYAIIFK